MVFDDLEVGMITKDGLIMGLYKAGNGLPAELETYYDGANVIHYMLLEDAYIGSCVATCDDDQTFEEVIPRGTLLYTETVAKLMKDRNKAALDAAIDVESMMRFLVENSFGR